jgi:chaperonin GroES
MGDWQMKFRPLHDRVLVRRVDEDTKTAGGIIIPDTAQEKPSQGEVLPSAPARWAMMAKPRRWM